MTFNLTIAAVIYDEVQYLPRLLKNLKTDINHNIEAKNKTFQAEWLFVLNHPDPTVKKSILNIISQELNEFSYYENPTNSIGAARNILLEKSKSKFIYFTDPDIHHKPQALSSLYKMSLLHLDKNPILGYTGPVIHRSGNIILNRTFNYLHLVSRKLPFSFQIQNHSFLHSVDHAPTCHLLILRSEALALGGFNPQLCLVGEDLDFSHRAFGAQKRFLFLPEASVEHEQNFDLQRWIKKVFLFGRAQIAIHRLNWHLPFRHYRLAPMLFSIMILTALGLWPFLTVSLFAAGFLLHLFWGFAFFTFLLTLLAYSFGQLCEVFRPKIKLQNVQEPKQQSPFLASTNWNNQQRNPL